MKRIITLTAIIIAIFLIRPTYSQNLRYDTDSLVNAIVSQVSQDSIYRYIEDLQDMGTRFLIYPNRKDVANWLKDQFINMGISNTVLDSFQCYTYINYPPALYYDTTTWQYNVVARWEGSIYPDEVIVLGGHYDNVLVDGDPMFGAPGADDNASGTAAILETARVLTSSGYIPERTIEFVPFSAEELMNFGDCGSKDYAQKAAAAGKDIVMMINNDMIGYTNTSSSIDITKYSGMEHIADMTGYICDNYTSLNAIVSPPQSSGSGDTKYFVQNGFPCTYLMEKQFNPYYHTINDSLSNMDMSYCTEAIKISAGTIAYFDVSVGINEKDMTLSEMLLYPNPARGHFKIILPGNEKENLNMLITDVSGREIYSNISYDQGSDIPVSGWAEGLYFVRLIGKNATSTAKLIVD